MDSNTIADRLREFGQSKFGNMTLFATALGMSPQALSPYLNGRRNPGKRMLAKLEQLGANPGYISGEGGSGDSGSKKSDGKSDSKSADKSAPKRRGRKPKAKAADKPAAKKDEGKTEAKSATAKKGKPGRKPGRPKAAAKAAPKKAAASKAAPKKAAAKKGKPGRPKAAAKAAPKKAAASKAAPNRRGRKPKAAAAAADTGVSRAEMQLLEYLRKIGLANVEAVVNLLESIKSVSDEDYMKKFRRAKPRKIIK